KDRDHSSHSLYLYGWGDGGGRPEPDMIESAQRLRSVDGAPRVELGGVGDFFPRAKKEAHGITTWVGELYFELHRGTYTSQARTKLLNRRAQDALREAEMWSVAAGSYPREELDRAWKTLLTNQFHDILPGSSIDWVYEEAERDLAAVVAAAEDMTSRATDAIAGRGPNVAVFNATSHSRGGVAPC